jgi:hypothetical protein
MLLKVQNVIKRSVYGIELFIILLIQNMHHISAFRILAFAYSHHTPNNIILII